MDFSMYFVELMMEIQDCHGDAKNDLKFFHGKIRRSHKRFSRGLLTLKIALKSQIFLESFNFIKNTV